MGLIKTYDCPVSVAALYDMAIFVSRIYPVIFSNKSKDRGVKNFFTCRFAYVFKLMLTYYCEGHGTPSKFVYRPLECNIELL